MSMRHRSLVLTGARALALLGVAALFAVLVYRVAGGNPGARLVRAVAAHRAPAAPDMKLTVIWKRSETWPPRLRRALRHGTLSLQSLRGYPVVLNFWASWCTPCEREAELLASAAQAQRGRVVFLAVDVHDYSGDARRFLRAHRVPFVAVRSGASAIGRFGLVGLPETFYIDRRGRITGMTRGQLSTASFRQQLDAVSGAAD
jgi:cytochrome c biogenesis protein CcmG, thiol:disulfide interchange protein DsbE